MEPLKVLSVCTGNICRSPLSEYYLRAGLNPAVFQTASAGTAAAIGSPVPDAQVQIARKLGIASIVEHEARQITLEDVEQADLVLTATLRHRRQVVRALPTSSGKVFTMREYGLLAPHVAESDFAQLLEEGMSPARLPAAAVHRLRGTIAPPASDDEYNIVDPIGQNKRVYRTAADQLVCAHRPIIELLTMAEGVFHD
ncbi:MAG: hypothetical protein ACTHW1_05795 [Ancrocorticia sp.]|uniref:arsenate reductase/protein-tyrosine-phosphatase family protein n=1 Tax=Ancrocorticia sp. TaxID=2593684 RepID=UPI003F92AC40